MKKALIIINTSKEASVLISHKIGSFLEDKGIKTDFLNFDGTNKDCDLQGYDFVITLGGDGTVLFAARNAVEYDIPVFPINFGQFGFIASVQPIEWKDSLQAFLNGEAPIEERFMINVQVERQGKVIYTALGLNDVVITAKRGATTVSLDVDYDELPLCRLKADGVIVSTSTGSTAYSAAAGGPIVDPRLSALVLTPMNSFSLSSRPIVLSPNGVLCISVEPDRTKEINLTVDGQEPVCLQVSDKIIIKRNHKKIKLVYCTEDKFYNALRSKLNWSGGPCA